MNNAGCSIEQLVPCDGPWKNHGEYLKAFKRTASDFFNQSIITSTQLKELEQQASRSHCGTP